MAKMLSSAFKWPWNRGGTYGVFCTNNWQQDYAMNLFGIGFLQDCTLLDINNTSNLRPIFPLEAVQNLPVSNQYFGQPSQVCLIYNHDMQYAKWGATGVGTGNFQNPQAGQTIIDPIGWQSAPTSPNLQIKDSNKGFLWKLNAFGTLGATEPEWPDTVVFPSYKSLDTVATTIDDGTAQWIAVNPFGQGFRIAPMPPQTGRTYQVWPVWQNKPIQFVSMQQTIDPVPDDFAPFFFDGMAAVLYQQVPDPKIRAKHIDSISQWEKSLSDCKRAGDRTRDSAVMYPGESIMGSGVSMIPSPARPFG
jgi:hypothetical protein